RNRRRADVCQRAATQYGWHDPSDRHPDGTLPLDADGAFLGTRALRPAAEIRAAVPERQPVAVSGCGAQAQYLAHPRLDVREGRGWTHLQYLRRHQPGGRDRIELSQDVPVPAL